MKTAIAVQELGFTYGDRPVLENINFTVGTGELFTIIGPNGSGKTTLMKFMAGVLKGPRGRLILMGNKAGALSRKQKARMIAFVPQSLPKTFPFSVRELVLMGRSPHMGNFGLADRTDVRRAEEAMQMTGVSHLAARKLNQISGGEQQRVFITRALCQDPEIILLDEPTAALDPAHQVRIMDLMEKLSTQQGLTVIMVSHDINLAAMYADRIMLLKSGRMISLGPPGEVLVEETLAGAYECELHVDRSPVGDYLQITPVPQKEKIIFLA